MSDEGLIKAAILLLALGEDEAAEVMKHLIPKDVQKLGVTMSTLKSVSHDDVERVLGLFVTTANEKNLLGTDSDEYIRSVLIKALGDDKASGLIGRIMNSRDSNGIESLKWMDGVTVAELIENEHPQIVATILVHLEPDHASDILCHFTERLRQDVILRIATLDGVKPLALKELNEVLTKLLIGNENLNKRRIGGIKAAAGIMNFMSGATETALMESIKNYDEEMAQKIMDEMFTFDDILNIDDKGVQIILREVQSESLIIALKGATEQVREKIFTNMSTRAAEMMKEDLANKGLVKLSEVEEQQKQILQIVRRLADEGQVMLGGQGGDDQYV
jgi:flagellar motor switch protein FliG